MYLMHYIILQIKTDCSKISQLIMPESQNPILMPFSFIWKQIKLAFAGCHTLSSKANILKNQIY